MRISVSARPISSCLRKKFRCRFSLHGVDARRRLQRAARPAAKRRLEPRVSKSGFEVLLSPLFLELGQGGDLHGIISAFDRQPRPTIHRHDQRPCAEAFLEPVTDGAILPAPLQGLLADLIEERLLLGRRRG